MITKPRESLFDFESPTLGRVQEVPLPVPLQAKRVPVGFVIAFLCFYFSESVRIWSLLQMRCWEKVLSSDFLEPFVYF